jgi:hypothetical protein
MDARALLTAWFSMGDLTTVDVGGKNAVSHVSERGWNAIVELVLEGYATAEPVMGNGGGRMRFVGTDKVHDVAGVKLTERQMRTHGAWSPTEPNPLRNATPPKDHHND